MLSTTHTTQTTQSLYGAFLRQFILGKDISEKQAALFLHFWAWLKTIQGKRRPFGINASDNSPAVMEYSHLTVEAGELWIHFYIGKTGKKLNKQPLAGSTILGYFNRKNQKPDKQVVWF